MIRYRAAWVALGLLLAGPGQAPEPTPYPSITLPDPLARVLTDYETAWQNRDAAALAALFAEDGFEVTTGSRGDRA